MSAAARGLVAGLAGVVFAVGLGLSGMTQPASVVGFLDVTGDWKPALALVMVGAISVHAIGWRIARSLSRPVLGPHFVLPSAGRVDRRLILGAALFGVGWGVSGACPGPALVNLASGTPSAVLFVLSMVAGMRIADLLLQPRTRTVPAEGLACSST